MSNQMGKNKYLPKYYYIIPQNIWEKYLYFRCNTKKGKAKSLSNFHNTGQKLINENSIFFMISKKMFQFQK